MKLPAVDRKFTWVAAFWLALYGLLPNLLLRLAWGAEADEGYWLSHCWLAGLFATIAWLGGRLADRRNWSVPSARWLFVEMVVGASLLFRLVPADLFPVAAALCLAAAAVSLASATRSARMAVAALLGALLLPLGWLRGYEELFGAAGFDTYLAVFQTSPAEASAYLWRYLEWQQLQLLLLYLAWTVVAWRADRECSAIGPARSNRALIIGLFTAALLLPVTFSQGAWQRWNVFSGSLVRYDREVARQTAILAGMQSGNSPAAPLPTAFRGNLIFIIGESTTRRHLALYGYHRPTTPFLSAARDRLLIHNNTVALHTHTILALPPLFQDGGPGGGGGTEPAPPVSLIAMLRRGGFTTYWFSNQNEFGLWDNLVSLIGKQADRVKFFRKSFGEMIRGDVYDQDMLPDLSGVLAEPGERKAIFLHLYSAHHPYSQGIPPDQRAVLDAGAGLGPAYSGTFPANAQEINSYDNAIRAVDSLIERIVRLADAQAQPTAVVFLPDHGENPADGSYHNSAKHSAYQIEIPHLWYFNDASRTALRPKLEAFERNRGKLFVPRDITPTLLDLLGFPGDTYAAGRSLFSPAYRPGSSAILCDGEACLDYDSLKSARPHDYLEIARLNLGRLRSDRPEQWEKVWAHRVDTIGKLLEAKEYFAGVEADIVFDAHAGEFFVYHPPAANVGLTLADYLQAARDKPELRLWLDWKNATPENLAMAMSRLDQLERQFNLKGRSIVETGSGVQFSELALLGRAGYRHAYYAPTEALVNCAGQPEAAQCRKVIRSIAATARQTGAALVSYDGAAGDTLLRHRDLLDGLDLICWNLAVDVTKGNALAGMVDVAAHKAYLVAFHTRFER